MSHCIDVAVGFDRESDSYGRLVAAVDATTDFPDTPLLAVVPDVNAFEGY